MIADIPEGPTQNDGQATPTSSDLISINARFLRELNREQAQDLIDVIVHEGIHFKAPAYRHPDPASIENDWIFREADIRARYVINEFQRRRGVPCK